MTGADIKWLKEEGDPIEELTKEQRAKCLQFMYEEQARADQRFIDLVFKCLEGPKDDHEELQGRTNYV